MNATGLIAEDEPLLAANLQRELARLWPELRIVANVGHGAAAVEAALAQRPDVLFLDIRMPGMTGLEAAQALAEDWPAAPGDGQPAAPFPLIVFVTAYDQYALQAFERAAVDYVLKPVRPERLAETVTRLQGTLRLRATGMPGAPSPVVPAAGAPGAALDATLLQLRELLALPGLGGAAAARTAATPKLSVVQAASGSAIHLVPIGDVLYFEAADKYVRVVTSEREHLIRTSLRELLPQLDAERFWQVHRGTVVRADAIATAVRDDTGKVILTLRGHRDKLVASRLYAHLFKAM